MLRLCKSWVCTKAEIGTSDKIWIEISSTPKLKAVNAPGFSSDYVSDKEDAKQYLVRFGVQSLLPVRGDLLFTTPNKPANCPPKEQSNVTLISQQYDAFFIAV